jgi:hypothetical protein
VLSMLWHGFPVVKLLSVWAGLTLLWSLLFGWLDRHCRPNAALAKRPVQSAQAGWSWRGTALLALVLISVVAARGTLRQGLRCAGAMPSPPIRCSSTSSA